MNETIILGAGELLSFLNQSSGIPLTITQTTTTNPMQFYLTIAISSIFTFYLLFQMLGTQIVGFFSKIVLKIFMRKSDIKNTIVIKHTFRDLFSTSMITQSTLEKIQKALIKFKGKPFNLILYTPGGEIFSATYISRMFSQYSGKIRSIIPTFAMSGGTLLALSTDEICMNDYSSLGAVDPQLGTMFKFGSARAWKEILKIKGKKAEDSSISMNMMGQQYTKSMKNQLTDLLKTKWIKKN